MYIHVFVLYVDEIQYGKNVYLYAYLYALSTQTA